MEMPYASRRIFVRATVTRQEASFVVRDEGNGFDPSPYLSTTMPDADGATGRGIMLMRSVMDEVRYNAAGNEVTLIKRRAPLVLEEETEATKGDK
jgi:anti-sigma regulatory factor (Ser/Thr protein kinase)